ncbi:hypothetical protein QN277_027270 [Acacia crassicarpa]|uniref:Uncharacterized protein n=1 Tax=Acacia crassicarpa TaxID=499986 RepID=A0AAE1K5R9_9FABA|nr:hypothetical protein QN277_027270 [Acacia crassicarpa]
MGDALFMLQQVLLSRREKVTPEEANILNSCKSKALEDFADGAIFAGVLAWSSTWKLKRSFRVNLAAGSAAFFGFRRFFRSLDSSIDHILQMDGTRMQKELADILVNQFPNDPSKMQLISKYFYTERVYDDSTSHYPKLRWRYRNSYSDDLVNGQRKLDHDFSDSSFGDSYDDSQNSSQSSSKEASDGTKTTRDTKCVFVNPALDRKEGTDPLDYLFAFGGPVEEIHHSSTPNKPPGIHNRGHRRYHRRRRMRHHQGLPNSEV